MDLKIIGWTSFDSEFPSVTISDEEVTDVLLIVAREIMDKGYVFSGNDHQNASTGVPVFENGTCFRASMRVWGTVMAAAFPEVDGKEMNYMDFYMSTPLAKKLPEENSIDVMPMENGNFNGMISPQDSEMISQSVQMGIPFMTTDKALKRIMDELNKIIEDNKNN